MFNLNDAIAAWRKNLSQDSPCRPVDLDELESHLREQIADLLARGLSEEESFRLAAHRLGDLAALKLEYAKVDTACLWRDRFLWGAMGILGWWLASAVATVFGSLALVAGATVGVRGYPLGAAISAAHYAPLIAILPCVFLLVRRAARRGVSPDDWRSSLRWRHWVPVVIFLAIAVPLHHVSYGLVNAQLRPSELGRLFLFQAYVGLIVSALVPMLLAILLARFCHARRAASVAESS
jgi:hypothetical protein